MLAVGMALCGFANAALSETVSRSGFVIELAESAQAPGCVVFDIRSVEMTTSYKNLLHVMFQEFKARPELEFDCVVLAHDGVERFRVPGPEMRRMARSYVDGGNVTIALILEFPSHVTDVEGRQLYPTWTGGLIGRIEAQAADGNSLADAWFRDAVLAAR